jgi:hypothetical protein
VSLSSDCDHIAVVRGLHRLGSSVKGEVLATTAGNPHLEDVIFRWDGTYLTSSDLLPLVDALAKQPPSMPPLKVHASFQGLCVPFVYHCVSIAGGRPLVLVQQSDNDSETGSKSEESSEQGI